MSILTYKLELQKFKIYDIILGLVDNSFAQAKKEGIETSPSF
ncbi:MAG: hypothetical protein ACD_60C00010G0003 [uncultured bacterium]|nr:MAG: hypothetical protein ACD_60C00010G0003 [uncultured bacterium]